MAKSFCSWLILVNHVLITIYNHANMAFNAIRYSRENFRIYSNNYHFTDLVALFFLLYFSGHKATDSSGCSFIRFETIW